METRARVAEKAEPELKPRQVVKRAGELVREAETLVKKKGKRVAKPKRAADEPEAPSNVANIMDALRKSIATEKKKDRK